MKKFEPKSKPLWFIFTSAYLLLTIFLVAGLFIISQLTFSKNIDEIIDIQTDVLNEQIVYNFEVYTNEIIEVSNKIQTDVSNIDLVNDNSGVEQLINTISDIDEKYKSISIYDLNGNRLVGTGGTINSEGVLNKDWFNKSQEDKTRHFYSTHQLNNGTYEIIISKYIPINKYDEYAVLKMEIDFSTMIDIVNKSNLGNLGHISIINEEYNYVYSSKIEESISNSDEIEVFRDVVLGSKSIKINNEQMLLIVSTITNTPWRIGSYININDSMLVKKSYIISVVIFSVIFLLVSSVFFYTISKGITRPLNRLKETMSNIERERELEFTGVEVKYPREVEVLNYNFNVMMKRIDNLMHRVLAEQTAQRKSELKALQNQINPHFLYNTLDSIVWMVDNNKNDDAVEMIISLSKLFKISISGGRNIISVADETQHARSYLFIQKIRYKDKFQYEIDIEDENILKLNTMKLILQPLIENALYHGISKVNDNGLITIKVSMENRLIRFAVSDNGYGMTKAKIQELYNILDNDDLTDGVGLKNIYQRLKVYYGRKARLEISSEADEGTTISIVVPAGDVI